MPPPAAANPGSDATGPSVGETLTVSAEHLRGLHHASRTDCWRCRRDADAPERAGAGADTGARDR